MTTPSAYATGRWNWTQLYTAGRKGTSGGTQKYDAMPASPNPINVFGVQGIDGQYPYLGQWWAADGQAHGNADSPSKSFNTPSGFTQWSISETFNAYLMFQPADGDSKPVPLQTGVWKWAANASLPMMSTTWNVSGQSQSWTPGMKVPNPPPTWNVVLDAGQFVYVP